MNNEELAEQIKFVLWMLEEALGELDAINKFLTDFDSDGTVDSVKMTNKLYRHFHRLYLDAMNCDAALDNMIIELSETTDNGELIELIKAVGDTVSDIIVEYDIANGSLAALEGDELSAFIDALTGSRNRMRSNLSLCRATLNDIRYDIMYLR